MSDFDPEAHRNALIVAAIEAGYCHGCKFWQGGNGELADGYGECRRYAPAPARIKRRSEDVERRLDETGEARAHESNWPLTFQRDWCGDYSDKRR